MNIYHDNNGVAWLIILGLGIAFAAYLLYRLIRSKKP